MKRGDLTHAAAEAVVEQFGEENLAAIVEVYREFAASIDYRALMNWSVKQPLEDLLMPLFVRAVAKAVGALRLGEVQAELEVARSVRLEWASIRGAVNPEVHTPARTVAYLKAHGWVKDWERRGGEDWHDQPDRDGKMRYAFVPLDTGFVDWDKRMAELVRDLADAYGMGELQILADIAEAGDA